MRQEPIRPVPQEDLQSAILNIQERLRRVNEADLRQRFEAACSAAPLTTPWAAMHRIVAQRFPGYELLVEEEAADTYIRKCEERERRLPFFCFDPMVVFYQQSGIAKSLAEACGISFDELQRADAWALFPTLHHNRALQDLLSLMSDSVGKAELAADYADQHGGEVLMDLSFWEVFKTALIVGYVRTEPAEFIARLRGSVYSEAQATELAWELLKLATPYGSFHGGGVVLVHANSSRAAKLEAVVKELIVEPQPEGLPTALFKALVPQQGYARAARRIVIVSATNRGRSVSETEAILIDRGLVPRQRNEDSELEATVNRDLRRTKQRLGLPNGRRGRPRKTDANHPETH